MVRITGFSDRQTVWSRIRSPMSSALVQEIKVWGFPIVPGCAVCTPSSRPCFSQVHSRWPILLSIIWHGINFQTDFYYALGEYFASGLGYLNIIILELIFVGSGIFGGFLKSLRFNHLKQQHQELFLTDTNLREMK